MSTLFVRRSPVARLRFAYRTHRFRPRREGLTGPLLLAVAIAVAGHQVGAPAAGRAGASPVASSRAITHVAPSVGGPGATDRGSARLSSLLGDDSAAPSAPVLARRTPPRASRSDVRRLPVKPAKPVVRTVRWTRPSGGPLTSPYGSRWGRLHEGLDFGASYGSPVRAASSGVVIFAAYDGGYGKQVRIRHANGVVTSYSHLSKIVVTGGRVDAGDVIGKVGTTGSSTGPHLHFEVLIGGTPVNPRTFLAKRGVRV